MCSLTDGNIIYKLSKNSSGVYYFKKIVDMAGYPTERYQEVKGVGDFNGDGKSDLLVNSKADRSYWEIAYSSGVGFDVKPFSYAAGKAFQDECPYADGPDDLLIADYNGDGKSDILHKRFYCNETDFNNKTQFIYYTFNGYENFNAYSVEYPYALSGRVHGIITDENGDGKAEFSFKRLSLIPSVPNQEYMHTMYYKKDAKSQFIEKISDGFNNITTFEYEPLTKSTGIGAGDFYRKTSGGTTTVNKVQYPMYVTTAMQSPDGVGGVNTTNFKYENLLLHRAGRGLLGFQKVISINSLADVRSESIYDLNLDYYVPYLKTTKTYLHSIGTPLSQTDNTMVFEPIAGTAFCFVQKNTESTSQDLLKGVTSTTTNTIDADGNVTNTVNTVSGGGLTQTTTTASTYVATAGSPIPNRPAQVTSSSQRGSLPSVQNTNTFTYDSKGQVLSSASKLLPSLSPYLVAESQYDVYGNVTLSRKQYPGLTDIPETKYGYDDKGRFMIWEQNTFDDKKEISTHKFFGKPLSVKGYNGLTTTYTYDAWGKLTSTTIPTSPSASYTVNYSDGWDLSGTTSAHQLYYTLVQDPSAPDAKTWYDYLGRAIRNDQETFGGAWSTARTSYNAKGNVVSSTNNYLPAETPFTTTSTYDEFNRIKTSANPFGTTNYAYTQGLGLSTTTVTLPDLKIKSSTTDATGKLIKSSNGIAGTVHYDYDSRGNEIGTKIGTSSMPYNPLINKEYDQLGQLKKMIDQDAGTTSYEYNAFGQLRKQTDPKGKYTIYQYDKHGRLTGKTLDGYETTYDYYGKDKDYRLATAKVKKTSESLEVRDDYNYYTGGDVSVHTKTTNGMVTEKNFTYDTYGNPLMTFYGNSGFGTRNYYDANGFLQRIATNIGGTAKTLYETIAMNGNGQTTRYKRVDGLTATTMYDNGIATNYNTPGVQDLSMTYDYRNGNVMNRHDAIANTQENFTYDAIDRLKIAQPEKIGTVSYPELEMKYDDFFTGGWSLGRLIAKSDVGVYSYSGFPRNAVKSVTDPAGIISHGKQNIVYNPFHKTQKITEEIGGINYEESFVYDAAEDRAYSQKRQGLAPTDPIIRKRWYMGDMEIDQKLDVSGAVTGNKMIHYISSDVGLVGMVVTEGLDIDYYAAYTDHLGSIVALTDEAGTVIARQAFDAWGRERNPDTWGYGVSLTGPSTPEWLYRGYTGHEMLPEYGLINMNGRMYDPLNGRMLRPDNFVTYPDNTQSYNRYSYAMNNPLKFTDPDGNHPLVAAAIIGASFAAANYTYQVTQSQGGFNNWNWGNFAMTTLQGGAASVVTAGFAYGIGQMFGNTGTLLNEVGRAGSEGLANYLISGGDKSSAGSAIVGSLSGSFTSLIGGGLNTVLGSTIFAAGLGGITSGVSGGNMLEGAGIAAIIHLANQLEHQENLESLLGKIKGMKEGQVYTIEDIQKLAPNIKKLKKFGPYVNSIQMSGGAYIVDLPWYAAKAQNNLKDGSKLYINRVKYKGKLMWNVTSPGNKYLASNKLYDFNIYIKGNQISRSPSFNLVTIVE